MKKRDKELMKQAETECGFNPDKFADLIRADEREACAVVAEKYEYSGGWLAAAKNIAAAIRARGNT